MALSPDGDTALVGGPGDNEEIGAAWVFTRSGSTWTEQGEKLTGTLEPGFSDLGSAVALSADGKTALIGGAHDDGYVGAAWVFVRKHDKWTEQAKLTGTGELGSGQFGTSVALSSDGKTALIGAPGDNNGLGAAWVFRRSDSTWRQRGSKLVGKDVGGAAEEAHCDPEPPEREEYCFVGHPARLGESVALSSNGKTALISAPGDNEYDGAAWVFTRSGSTWTQLGEKLTGGGEHNSNQRCFPEAPPCHIGGRFGASAALSGDGNTALIGGPFDDTSIYEGGPRPKGAAWVFTRSGSTWTQQGEKLTGVRGDSPAGRALGESVALSANGNTALAGGPYADWSREPEGAAWVFTRSGTIWTEQGERLKNSEPVEGGWDEELGVSLALSSDGSIALIGNRRDAFAHGEAGSALVFTRSDSTWTQLAGKLGCSSGDCRITLSGDGRTALVGTAVYVNASAHK